MPGRALRSLPMVVWITVVWVALWGEVSWGNVVGGVLVAVLVLLAVRRPARERVRRVAPGPAVVLAAVFCRDLVVATLEVARQVLWPVGRLRPAVVAVRLSTTDAAVISVVANAITLTPGSLTLDADGERGLLWVHLLHCPDGAEEALVAETRALEQRAARALRVELEPSLGEGP